MNCCRTHDEHFESDDERWAGGNYYTDKNDAERLSSALKEEFQEPLEDITSKKDRLKVAFCSFMLKNTAPLPAKPKRMTKKYVKSIEDQYNHIYKLVKEYRKEWASLAEEESALRSKINDIIYYLQPKTN